MVLKTDGNELVLLPVNSEEYQKSVEHTNEVEAFHLASKKRGKLKESEFGDIFENSHKHLYFYLGKEKLNPLKGMFSTYYMKAEKFHLNEKGEWNYHYPLAATALFYYIGSGDNREIRSHCIESPQMSTLVKVNEVDSKDLVSQEFREKLKETFEERTNFEGYTLSDDKKSLIFPISEEFNVNESATMNSIGQSTRDLNMTVNKHKIVLAAFLDKDLNLFLFKAVRDGNYGGDVTIKNAKTGEIHRSKISTGSVHFPNGLNIYSEIRNKQRDHLGMFGFRYCKEVKDIPPEYDFV